MIAEMVAAGLSKLDDVSCGLVVSAFREIVEIGLLFVPGDAVLRGIEGAAKVIRYAKSAYENGSTY